MSAPETCACTQPGRIGAADLEAIAAQLLIDAVDVEAALAVAFMGARDATTLVRAFVTPRARAARLIRMAAHQLAEIPDVEGLRLVAVPAIAPEADGEAEPLPARRRGRPPKIKPPLFH